MRQIKLWQFILCLAFSVFYETSAFAKAADDYLIWNQARDYQKVLYKAARESKIDVDSQLVQEFNQLLRTDNDNLLPWARKLDHRLERIEKKNREFSREFNQLLHEERSLEQEKARVKSEDHLKDLNRRIKDYNRRFFDAKRRHADHQKDVDTYNDEALNRYNPQVRAWQARVRAFRAKQKIERQRLLDQLNKHHGDVSIPDPSSFKPRISAEKAAEMAVKTITAPFQANIYAQEGSKEAVGWARKNPEKAREVTKQVLIIGTIVGTAFITKNPGVVRTVASVISIEQTAEEVLEAAAEKEVRRVKEDEDNARKFGTYLKNLREYRNELKESGVGEEKIAEKMASKEKKLRKDLPKSLKNEDFRLLENMINKKTGKIILREIALQVLSRGIARRLDPEVKIPTSTAEHKVWLDKMHKRPEDTRKLLIHD